MDARPLTEPVDRTAVTAYARQLRQEGRAPSAFGGIAVVIASLVIVVFVFVFGTTFISIAGSVIALTAGGAQTGGPAAAVFLVVPFLIMAAIAVAIVFGVIRALSGTSERWYRLDRFARANGMTYVPRVAAPQPARDDLRCRRVA